MTGFSKMRSQIKTGAGFIAALDQSGGSTPKALALYGVNSEDYKCEEEMYAEIQHMRARIIQSKSFTRERLIGAILFEKTMTEIIEGNLVPMYLWNVKSIVPFLKIDKGLENQHNDVQLLKPIKGLANTLAAAKETGIFGTKERSVIHNANKIGIDSIVLNQFEVASEVLSVGLVQIIEPEVNIYSERKAQAEALLLDSLLRHLDSLGPEQDVMLKLTLPDQAGLYDGLANHPRVLRVAALSGGYSTVDASIRLSKNHKMIASFSRALTEGLRRKMLEDEFNEALGGNIEQIFQASIA